MPRPKGKVSGSSPNPKYALTPEKYSAMLKAYLEQQPNVTIKYICESAGVGRPMASRAVNLGWPEWHLPPLGEAPTYFTDPVQLSEYMETCKEKDKELVADLFKSEADVPEVIQGEKQTKLENEAAAKLSKSITMKTAKTIEKLADHYMELIEAGAIDLPDTLRPEHLFMLAKATDTAANAIHKALSSEKIVTGKPEMLAGAHITNLLIGATPEELRQVALTGHLPPRLLGIDTVEKPKDVIDVDAVTKALKADPTLADKKEFGGSET